MKKLLSMLGAIGLVATSSATVVSCGDKDEAKVLDLSKTTNEINVVGVEGSAPVAADILKAFNKANGNAKLELTKDVNIDAITVDGTVKTKYTATITAVKDDKLATGTGTLTITLVAAPALDLAKTTNEIKVVGAAGTAPVEADILKAFNTANGNAKLELTKDVTIDTITVDGTNTALYTAKIKAAADSKLATGEGTLKITLVAAPVKVLDLSKTTNEIKVVGAAGTAPVEADILKAFNTANGNAKLELTKDVTIDTITVDGTNTALYTAKIKAATDSKLATGEGTLKITLVDAA